jgi:hypothetical protein
MTKEVMITMFATDVPVWWKWGRPAELWFQHQELVQELVDRHRLQATTLRSAMKAQAEQGEATFQTLRPQPIDGGMRVPHLHLGDQVYRLNSEQWKEFSANVVKTFSAKLAKAGTVSLGRLIELSSVVDSLP